jgi:hypothetical protein
MPNDLRWRNCRDRTVEYPPIRRGALDEHDLLLVDGVERAGAQFPDAQWRMGSREMTAAVISTPKTKTRHALLRTGFSSKTIDFEQNTMVDRTSQAAFDFFIHR